MSRSTLALLAVLTLTVNSPESADIPNADLRDQVRSTEAAFAKTMADRDHAAFASFLADEAVFFGRSVLRGKAAVAAGWKRFYEDPTAPGRSSSTSAAPKATARRNRARCSGWAARSRGMRCRSSST